MKGAVVLRGCCELNAARIGETSLITSMLKTMLSPAPCPPVEDRPER